MAEAPEAEHRDGGLRVEAPLHAGLHYHVLSHLDLGRDSASIYQPRPVVPSWVAALSAAYRHSPERLGLQFVPLWTADLEALDGGLGTGPMAAAMRVALDAERPAVESARALDDRAARRQRFEAEVRPDLQRARAWLYGGSAPPLRILDVPALGAHGRAMAVRGGRVVAVSLAEPSEHIFCQILHEETHPVSDPTVARSGGRRDTRAGSAGYEAHAALERAAVLKGAEAVAAATPGRADAYARWCARYGITLPHPAPTPPHPAPAPPRRPAQVACAAWALGLLSPLAASLAAASWWVGVATSLFCLWVWHRSPVDRALPPRWRRWAALSLGALPLALTVAAVLP
jgi:hypothetical protein